MALKDPIILNNVMPSNYVEVLQASLDTNMFPWFYSDNVITYENKDTDSIFGFTHCFYHEGEINSPGFDLVNKIVHQVSTKLKLKIKRIVRINANLLFNQTTKKEHAIHRDSENNNGKFISIIYYVNKSDGDTVLYDESKNINKKVTPLENSCLCFNSYTLHAASLPKQHKKRIVINCILEIE